MDTTTSLLLIDDDIDDQLFFRLAVSEIDPTINYMTANHGADGKAKLAAMKELPKMIFLDLNMPIMHGFECLKEIKKIRF